MGEGDAGDAALVLDVPAGSSAIGATVALARIRSVAGGTGNTALCVPAAAQTTVKRPRSGSMTALTGRA